MIISTVGQLGKALRQIIDQDEDISGKVIKLREEKSKLKEELEELKFKKGLEEQEINTANQRTMEEDNGIDIVTITKDGIKKVFSKEINTKIEI